ncbi:MAG: histidine--tRNA ligase [Patescibacteria group bacterium]
MPRELQPPQLLRGMKDILPVDQPYWWWLFDTTRHLADCYGFERIETPVLEATSLFTRSVGEGTDIVGKEMYTFADNSGDHVSLRPEGTAGVARAFIEHGMLNLPQPVKLWYFSPFFRHDRPQAGRYRQFWQFGFEIFGGQSAILEAQLIMMVRAIYQSVGLETTLQVNSIGDQATRAQYAKTLQGYLKTKKSELNEEQRLTLQKNPLRLLDSKDPPVQELLADAPQILDALDPDSQQHFQGVLGYLDELDVPFVLNPRLVRGLDYYNRTVFEFWAADDEAGQVSLGGGGRYDTLIEKLGGRPTPALGFAGGIERIILKLKEKQIPPRPSATPEIFVAQLGDPARRKMLKLFEQLRIQGIRVAESMTKDGIKQQLEVANRLGAHYTLIVGQKEMMDDTILIRDMENGIQEVVPFAKVESEIKKRLDKNRANGVTPVTGQVVPERLDKYRDEAPAEEEATVPRNIDADV